MCNVLVKSAKFSRGGHNSPSRQEGPTASRQIGTEAQCLVHDCIIAVWIKFNVRIGKSRSFRSPAFFRHMKIGPARCGPGTSIIGVDVMYEPDDRKAAPR